MFRNNWIAATSSRVPPLLITWSEGHGEKGFFFFFFKHVYARPCYGIDEHGSGQKSCLTKDELEEIGSSSMDHWRSKEPSGSQHGPCMKKNVLA